MPPTQSIRAGKAYVEMYSDNRQLDRSLAAAQKRIRAFGASVDMIGRRMAAAGAVMTAPFVLATKIFSDFDDQMRTVQAVTEASGQQFDMLTEKAKELGRTMSYTASQVAATMVELGRAGFNPQQIDDAIESVMNLARATGTELPTSANIAAATLRAFELEASEMGRVADVLTATANKSAQTLEDLGEAMKYAAPVAASYGLTLEETSKILGALANFSIRGSMAGTTMKQVLLQLAKEDIRQRLAELGVAVTDVSGNLLNASDVLKNLGQAITDIPPADRLTLLNDLFGQRAVAGGIKLTTANFLELNDAIDHADGTAARAAATMDSGIGGAFRRLMSAVEGVAIAVGDALAPTIARLAEFLTNVASRAAEWIARNKAAAVAAAEFAATITLLGTAMIAVGSTMKLVAFAMGGYTVATKAAAAATKALTGASGMKAFAGLASKVGLAGGVFGALLIALGAVTRHLQKADEAAMKLNHTMSESLTATEAQHRSDNLRVQRLQRLADKGALNNKEMDEARQLTGELTDRYGDLGISIDETTNSVGGLTDAIAALRRGQMARELEAVEAALAEARTNARKLGDKALWAGDLTAWTRAGKEQRHQDWTAGLERVDALENRAESLRITLEMAEAEKALADAVTIRGRAYDDLMASGTAENQKALVDAIRSVREQEERLADLRAAKRRLGEAPTDEADLAERIRTEDALTEAQAKQVAEWQQRLARQRIEAIENEYERELNLIDLKYAQELEKAKDNADAIALIKQAQQADYAALERRIDKDRAEALGDLHDRLHRERLGQIEDEWARERALINYRHAQEAKAAQGNAEMIALLDQLRDAQLAEVDRRQAKQDEAKRKAELASRDIGAKGTFNVRAIAGLQAGDATAKTNDLLTQIERNTQSLRNATGAVFAG
jgi:TP901 family phage tail tape measure protein